MHRRRRPSSGRGGLCAPTAAERTRSRIGSFIQRHDRSLLLLGGMLIALSLFVTRDRMQPAPRELAQDDIDAAVLAHAGEQDTAVARSQGRRAGDALGGPRARATRRGNDEPGAGEPA